MAVTGTLLAVLDDWGDDIASFIIPEELNLDIVQHDATATYSYAVHIHDGNVDGAWEIISQMQVVDYKAQGTRQRIRELEGEIKELRKKLGDFASSPTIPGSSSEHRCEKELT